ncbi:sodium:solute symporter family protein [Natrinema caseinilyticum]|uniref:sodium:solute symporter family protein n=1 Tax=Natrinema caseinilyticum TaxID=2961570 RepID=UPI0020C1D7C1|nr:sodium:solute symporter family protein [Natrinema caseinilyticum]
MTLAIPLQEGVTPEVSSGPLAIGVVLAYFAVVIGIGAYFYRKSRKSTSDFWIAGGQIPLWVQVFAVLSVTASAGSFFGYGGFAYAFGAAFGELVLVAVAAGGLFMMIFIAAPIRRSGVYTVPDYLKRRYQSDTVRLVAAVIFTIASWAYLIPQLTAGGITIDFVLPQLSYQAGVMAAALVFALYVSLGGMWAVTWTDFFQGIIMFLLTLVPVPIVWAQLGVTGTLNQAMAADPGFGSTKAPGLMHLGLGLVWILAFLALPQMGQRVLASDSDRTARRSFMYMNVLYIFSFTLSIFWVAGAAKVLEPNLANADYFYYAVLSSYFGPVMQGLGAAGLLSAVMSTTDALLVALSASVSHDIPKSLNVDLSERQETLLGVGVMWTGVIVAAVVAFNPPAIIGLMTTLVAGGAASGLFPALAVGTWWKRGNSYGAIASMIVGFLTYGILLFGDIMAVPYTEALVAVPLGLIVYIVVSLGTRRPTGDELAGFQEFHSHQSFVESQTETDD